MTGHRLALGDWLDFEDDQHEVVGLSGTMIRLRSRAGHPQLIEASVLLACATPVAAQAKPDVTRLDSGAMLKYMVDPAEAKRAQTLEGDLLEATTGYRSGHADQALPTEPRPQYDPALPLTQRIKTKAAELGKTERRIWQLLKSLRETGNAWGLVDERKARPRSPLAGVDPRIIDAIQDQWIAETDDNAGSLTRFYRRTQNRLDLKHGKETVTLPGQNAFNKYVRLVLGESVSAPTARRRSKANQPDRPFSVFSAIRAGQVVALDTTPLDVFAYDPEHDVAVKIELTVAIDIATRSLLGWRMTPESTKDIDVGLVIADMMFPEPMRPGWPDALRYRMLTIPTGRILDIDQRIAGAASRPVVYPETLLWDHGKPYQANVLRRACQQLGMNPQNARKMQPTDKANVERLFRTVGSQFSQNIAGHKGNDVAHRGRNVENRARWTIDELEDFFAEFVVAIYQRSPHGGLHLPGFRNLHMSPNEAYASCVELAGYVACPPEQTLYYEMLRLEERSIQPDGVQVGWLDYWGPILYDVRRRTCPFPSGKWPIRYDPRDVLHAYIQDPDTGQWHRLAWRHAMSDILPFTDTTLKLAVRILRQRGHRPTDQAALNQALRDLQNRLDAPESWTHTSPRLLARDAQRARDAAKDRHRAGAVIDEETTAAPQLRIVAQAEPEHLDESGFDNDLGIDLSTIKPAPIWNPAGQ